MRVKKVVLIIAIIFVIIALAIFMLFYNGILWFNNPSDKNYPVRGVDVSIYQGEIEWDVLAKQDIEFAFIKATEGSTHKDDNFNQNWTNAKATDLMIGAYHFFSFESSGLTQAQNFISTVENLNGGLPPVIDIEFYGDFENNPPPKEQVQANLNELISELEKHYNKKPIIYATIESYTQYIQGSYDDYPLWFRNVLYSPNFNKGIEWTFWQYSHRERLEGYVGEEKYIDMNVFNGTRSEFDDFISGEN